MVFDLEHTKTTQALEIDSLKRRVKKLKKMQRSRTHGLRRLYKVGLSARVIPSEDEGLGEEDASKQGRKIHDIDADEDITLDSTHFDTDLDMFGVHDLDGDEVFIETKEPVVNAATTASTILEQASTPITSSKDKGKGIMVEEPLKMKKKDQVLFDEQEAIRLQDQFDEEARIAREKEEANAALIAQWNDIQDKKRRKHFASKRAEERRNKPPTKAQQRSIMCTYRKNMAGWKPKDLKTKSFANVQELFDKAMKRVNTFVDMDTELVGGDELKQDKSKKQKLDKKVEAKVDNAKEAEELKKCLEVVPNDGDDVTIDDTPLSVKILIVKKMYPLTNHTLHQMFNDVKLQVDYDCEMAFEFLRLVKKQLKESYLVLLVQKLLLLVLKVNVAGIKVTTAEGLRLLKEFLLLRDG
ncbi:hypothetical protein Tco_0155073 [Tanacetum coccineum]